MTNFTILEPMSTGDVIDRAVRLYRRNLAPLLTVVAVPTVIGYIASVLFWYGYTSLILGMANPNSLGDAVGPLLMLGIGGVAYPVYMFAMLLAVAGMARAVGDHLMLGETITFKKVIKIIRPRLGDILLMGLLLIVAMTVLSFALYMAMLALGLGMVFLISAVVSGGLPNWLAVLISVVIVLAALGGMAFVGLFLVSRVVFLPQVVMIEGQSAGAAFSRAIQLGARNWYRVGAIVLFDYFITLSLLAALTLPLIAGIEILGYSTAEFFLSTSGSAIYSAFNQLSSMLVMPLWVVSFTLLYFDNRVRKEAYDIELLAREITPGGYWQPAPPPAAFGYPAGRAYVQTSPLGLAGYAPRPAAVTQPVAAGPEDLRARFDRAAATLTTGAVETPVSGAGQEACARCGAELLPEAIFCIRCGGPAGAASNGHGQAAE